VQVGLAADCPIEYLNYTKQAGYTVKIMMKKTKKCDILTYLDGF
ncbi:uncharacterized protein METZ01_LOCUS145404, partial [marine metagenome]